MCDYSLQKVASGYAKFGDIHRRGWGFSNSTTSGFSGVDDPAAALRPCTELVFEQSADHPFVRLLPRYRSCGVSLFRLEAP